MVSEVLEPGLRYVPMSWEEFLDLPEDTFAEWVDGVAVVRSNAVGGHGRAQIRLVTLLETHLPSLDVFPEVSIRLPRNRVRRPDVSAYAEPMSEDDWLMPATPVLVAEVLSPATRREDLVRKAPEYLEGAIQQYWIVDRSARAIEVLGNAGDHWITLAIVDQTHPSAQVGVGEWGTVPLQLPMILGP